MEHLYNYIVEAIKNTKFEITKNKGGTIIVSINSTRRAVFTITTDSLFQLVHERQVKGQWVVDKEYYNMKSNSAMSIVSYLNKKI